MTSSCEMNVLLLCLIRLFNRKCYRLPKERSDSETSLQ